MVVNCFIHNLSFIHKDFMFYLSINDKPNHSKQKENRLDLKAKVFRVQASMNQVSVIFNVFLRFSTMCLPDSLPDEAIYGGLYKLCKLKIILCLIWSEFGGAKKTIFDLLWNLKCLNFLIKI